MNKKIFSILLASMLVFFTKSNTSVLLIVKPSRITPIVEGTDMKDLLIKLRFKSQARKFDVQDILDKKHKAVAFKADSFDTVKKNYLTVELHNKINYDGKKPIADEKIIVTKEEQIRHRLNLGPLKVSVRTQVNPFSPIEDVKRLIKDNDLEKIKLNIDVYKNIPTNDKYILFKLAHDLKRNAIVDLLIKEFKEELIDQALSANDIELVNLLLEEPFNSIEDVEKLIKDNDLEKIKLNIDVYKNIPTNDKYILFKLAHNLKRNVIVDLLIKEFKEELIDQALNANDIELVNLLLEHNIKMPISTLENLDPKIFASILNLIVNNKYEKLIPEPYKYLLEIYKEQRTSPKIYDIINSYQKNIKKWIFYPRK